jgi:hypothetical protein
MNTYVIRVKIFLCMLTLKLNMFSITVHLYHKSSIINPVAYKFLKDLKFT